MEASAVRSSEAQRKGSLDSVHPQMLKAASPVDPQKLGEDALREIGQAFEWAIDTARTTKGALSTDLGYTDQGVIGRWVSGKERVQLDKLKVHAPAVYVEFLLSLIQMCDGVEVKTQVTLHISELDKRGWTRYPLRTCRTLHHCEICSRDITLGERYYDGGSTRRAHERCIPVAAVGEAVAEVE
jgi:hypothetical protein